MLLAATHGNDPPITREEERVLETLLEMISQLEIDEVNRWVADAIAAQGDSDVARTVAAANEADRLAAAAIARLSPDDRELLGALITRHPHTYFEGFHTPENLRRAFDLAQWCGAVRH